MAAILVHHAADGDAVSEAAILFRAIENFKMFDR